MSVYEWPAMQGFFRRVMDDDHIVALKAIEFCPDDDEQQVLIEMAIRYAREGGDDDFLRYVERFFRASGGRQSR